MLLSHVPGLAGDIFNCCIKFLGKAAIAERPVGSLPEKVSDPILQVSHRMFLKNLFGDGSS
jgi:hypothetical protein